jgi:hypothetical protein
MLVLASLAVLSIAAPTAGAKSVCLSIVGSGSSLQKVAQQSVWIPGFTKATGGWWEDLCTSAPTITYNSTSSGKGKEQWGYENKKLLDELPFPGFIGTDLAPSDPQIKNMGEAGGQPTFLKGVVAVPVAQSAISVLITLPTNCHPKAGETEAKVNAVKLAEAWEKGNKEFTEYVKGIECTASSLPNFKVRSSNSGTTAGFKRFFATLTDTSLWLTATSSPLKSEEPSWPAELEASGHFQKCCEKGSQLAELVLTDAGTTGYADLADARNAGFTNIWTSHGSPSLLSAYALVETTEPASEFQSPEEASSGGSNCNKAVYKEENIHSVAPGEDWSEVRQENVKKNKSYPICSLTYDLAWNSYETAPLEAQYGSKLLAEHVGLLVRYYLHAIVLPSQGQGASLLTNHYGLLPSTIRVKAEEGITEGNIKQ